MAQAAAKRCTQCSRIATHGGRCEQHQVTPWANKSANSRALTGRQRANFRANVLARADHTCEWCGKPATEADHILAIGLGGAPTDWINNGAALCRRCHATKTRSDNKRMAERRRQRRY